MKKITAVIFSIFYLFVATGFNIGAHWCGKKMYFVSVNAPHEKKCPCGKSMRPGCCKDVYAYCKIKDTQKASSKVIVSGNCFTKALTVIGFQKSEKLFSQVEVFDIANYHAPPFKAKLPIYLRGSTLRI